MSEDLRISAAAEKAAVIISEVKLDGQRSLNSQVLPVTEQDAERIYSEISICQEFNQSLSLDAKPHKNLSKCKTFPVSKETITISLPTNGKVGQCQESSGSGAAAYKRSVSLPVRYSYYSYSIECSIWLYVYGHVLSTSEYLSWLSAQTLTLLHKLKTPIFKIAVMLHKNY